ncbi:MAG TPA: hypothetical protein VIJ75_15925 [Hanamia sp.]
MKLADNTEGWHRVCSFYSSPHSSGSSGGSFSGGGGFSGGGFGGGSSW